MVLFWKWSPNPGYGESRHPNGLYTVWCPGGLWASWFGPKPSKKIVFKGFPRFQGFWGGALGRPVYPLLALCGPISPLWPLATPDQPPEVLEWFGVGPTWSLRVLVRLLLSTSSFTISRILDSLIFSFMMIPYMIKTFLYTLRCYNKYILDGCPKGQ